ncbi:type 4a pilus biogenesis protein PilO [Photobacterium carnosum]|uniref:type II secretion system protein GspM n=1 Tax=Photobacterium carnosum TaxID=2023717 RepID=UPI001E441EFB|nr:type II secretion system protein GspM [Photobacterium carnosum]MCD9494786.1 type 4a pilus biogenesis protein PilO [Photobacterium carnosum]MCD9538513.1 type 4a pilus biogenesis protein PilO [Photobacterium carnosum]MCD9545488.1 type 4a pilus biogenesis protein PilO [Photobacterium carnosum]MCD9552953.1 type 4a pilus biogenesis protein PilO [Photobacterium carnosum]MCD9557231.1 type 4a pilus biogenesis protein PilO [Photobacterium carnosum]
MDLWRELNQRFLTLSRREQWLIAITGWVAIIFIGFMLVIQPQMVTSQNIKMSLLNANNDIQTVKNEIIIAKRKLAINPNKELETKIEKYKQQNNRLAKKLETKIGSLVTPTQMTRLLEQVLRHSSALTLESMTSLPPQQLIPGNDVGYFMHPVSLTFRGSYFDVVDYLKKLETLPVKYYWLSLNYQVEKYPLANIELQVYTLGENKDFIGG